MQAHHQPDEGTDDILRSLDQGAASHALAQHIHQGADQGERDQQRDRQIQGPVGLVKRGKQHAPQQNQHQHRYGKGKALEGTLRQVAHALGVRSGAPGNKAMQIERSRPRKHQNCCLRKDIQQTYFLYGNQQIAPALHHRQLPGNENSETSRLWQRSASPQYRPPTINLFQSSNAFHDWDNHPTPYKLSFGNLKAGKEATAPPAQRGIQTAIR